MHRDGVTGVGDGVRDARVVEQRAERGEQVERGEVDVLDEQPRALDHGPDEGAVRPDELAGDGGRDEAPDEVFAVDGFVEADAENILVGVEGGFEDERRLADA